MLGKRVDVAHTALQFDLAVDGGAACGKEHYLDSFAGAAGRIRRGQLAVDSRLEICHLSCLGDHLQFRDGLVEPGSGGADPGYGVGQLQMKKRPPVQRGRCHPHRDFLLREFADDVDRMLGDAKSDSRN